MDSSDYAAMHRVYTGAHRHQGESWCAILVDSLVLCNHEPVPLARYPMPCPILRHDVVMGRYQGASYALSASGWPPRNVLSYVWQAGSTHVIKKQITEANCKHHLFLYRP